MQFLVPVIAIVISILHTWLLATIWPHALVTISPASEIGEGAPLLQGTLAFVITGSLALALSLARSKRLLAALGVLSTLVVGGVAYWYLPLAKVFLPSAEHWLGGLVGVVCAVVVCWSRFGVQQSEESPSPRFSTITAFCVVYNLLLLIAPSSVIFPTGYAGEVFWAHDTLILRHEDSVSIHNNLLFIVIRRILDPIVGNSLIANSLVSTVMTSAGLALMVMGIQRVVGASIAACAVLLMISERWVLVTAFSGNLPASVVSTCGMLFFVCVRIMFDPPQRSKMWHAGTFTLLVLATLLSLYSYAAVRMPFMLSVSFIALMYALQAQGSWVRKVGGSLIWVVAPVLCGFAIMCVGPYQGSVPSFQHDFLVTWPKESMIDHPGSQGLSNYQLERNFDTPLWQQIARPVDGTNKSVIWTKTPLEIVKAFRDHLVDIANNVPDLFFLQPLPFALALLALCALPALPTKARVLYTVTLVWSCLWLSTFLLVPDATAFRRAVGFPGAFVVVAALAGVPFVRSRWGRIFVFVLCVVVTITRLPVELAVANKTEARMRMFTLCATAPAHRALLTSPLIGEKRWGQLIVLPNGLTGGKELACYKSALSSTEWNRILPLTVDFNVPSEQVLSELERIPPGGTLVVAYCNFDSKRASHIDALCTTGAPGLRLLGKVENSFDGAHWVVFETQ